VSLKKIADALSITISSLFTDIETETDSFNNKITSDSISGNKNHSFPSFMNKNEIESKRVAIVRKGKRKKVIMPWGAFYEMLCPDLRHKIEFIYLTYPVGAKVGEFYSHEGEECGVVLEGKFRAIIGDEEIILEPGDSIYFDSSIPHRWETVGENEVKAIWAITPSSF
jgi:mannose-6-phosphate isomerase-like protein (cupin superfamily)